MRIIWNALLSALMATLPNVAAAQMTVYDVDLNNSNSIRAASEYCRYTEAPDRMLCEKSFYCGDGGCDLKSIIVLVDARHENAFYMAMSSLRLEELDRCSHDPDSYEFELL